MSPWRRHVRAELREVLDFLRADFPLRRPVSIRFVGRIKDPELGPCHGFHELKGGRHRIVLERRVLDAHRLARTVLMDEWAHARVAESGRRDRCEHGPAWRNEYGRMHSAWFDHD